MIVRHCAGGVVFYANKVFILKNDKGEWTLPKGKINEEYLKHENAINKVKDETGIEANILESAGDTMYEFYSEKREQQVCNAVTWYIMESEENSYLLRNDFIDGGFFKVREAMNMLSHSKEKSLVEISYQKYKLLKKSYTEGSLSQDFN